MTIGAERPPNGARHSRFEPFISHVVGRLVSADVPSRFAPRASGQSPMATRRGPCARAGVPNMRQIVAMERSCFSIRIRMLLEYAPAGKAAYDRSYAGRKPGAASPADAA